MELPELATKIETPHLEDALKQGAHIHVFRSAGGLRVVNMKHNGNSLAYGEHPYFENALCIAEEDCRAGGREYKEVYGPIHPHYLTGSDKPTSDLDDWVLRGRDIDIRYQNDQVKAVLTGLKEIGIPDELMKYVLASKQTIQYELNDRLYELSPSTFPSGTACVSQRVVEKGPRAIGSDHFQKMTKIGYGHTVKTSFRCSVDGPRRATRTHQIN